MKYYNNILETIGNTPLIKLNKVTSNIPALVLAKVETFNPGNSIKDRMAVKMIDDAEASGKIKAGGTIIECTSGNTGMGLALVACVRGYKCIFTTSDKQSKEKIDLLKALGAEVIVCPTNVEPTDPRSYYSVAEKLSKEINNSFWCNQYDNLSNAQAHYESTGPEIWDQTDGKITHLIVGVGTGGTISGTARYLKEKNPNIKIWGIDTYGSVFKKYHETGIFDEKEIYPYITEGIGEDILPKNVDFSIIDLFEKVSDKDAAIAARRLAREEGILLGYSAGSALAGLNQLSEKLTKDDVVVLIFHDHGSRYIGKIYNDDWMRERGFLDSEIKVKDLILAKKDKAFYSVEANEKIRNVLKIMKERDISQLPVLENDDIIGTVSENSILSFILENPLNNADKEVKQIMSDPMPKVSMDLPMSLLNKCFTEKIPGVITKDQNNQYHVLTKYDVIRAL
ncbi:MAG: pyridoxal-phosphate dependent enzyme [Saprospiraceae bacterium]|nr:pyridoxal-phosphate dependent enzyme [Candidatus Vicinibacter proximus]MCC6843599.1 pyridoxal-phosphate dependent enzyme [Saprospiraceae bacterium]HRG31680.1 pyridoxal-phosphate dependent enzyme [Saprospiraceae bacterium]